MCWSEGLEVVVVVVPGHVPAVSVSEQVPVEVVVVDPEVVAKSRCNRPSQPKQ